MVKGELIIYTGGYFNDNAIMNTINYTFRLENTPHFYYGIWPSTKENAISTFERLRQNYPARTCSKQVQHFVISFKTLKDKFFINSFAEKIAFLIAPIYPICFSLHDDTENMHVHFIASTTSHLPNKTPFEDNLWDGYYIKLLKDFAFKHGILLKEELKNARTI